MRRLKGLAVAAAIVGGIVYGALREDPRSVEKRAREDLGLSKEGEIVFILESETPELKRP